MSMDQSGCGSPVAGGRSRKVLAGLLLSAALLNIAASGAFGQAASKSNPPGGAGSAGNAAGRSGAPVFARADLLVSAAALRRELGAAGLLVLDARAPQAYDAGHIPGAVNLPVHTLDRSVTLSPGVTVPSLVKPASKITPLLDAAGINGDSRIVIYAQSFDPDATRLFWVLDYYGKRHVALLDGGLDAWVASGAALDTARVVPRPGNFSAVADPAKIADFEYVRSHLGSATTEVCDALSAQSFAGGAIPGSINLPAFAAFQNGTPLEQQAHWLAEVMREHHLSRDQAVVFYCATGYVSSMDYFVARLLGFERVRLYDGSLVDWRARGGALQPGGW